MLENNTFWVKVGLEFAKENIEPIIDILNALIGSFANLEVLRVEESYTFLFTPPAFESLFYIPRGFEAPTWFTVNPGFGSPSE